MCRDARAFVRAPAQASGELASRASALDADRATHDAATRELMVLFYDRYTQGADAAAAMRGAMVAMIEAGKWTHKQWAAFVIYGL